MAYFSMLHLEHFPATFVGDGIFRVKCITEMLINVRNAFQRDCGL